MLHLGVTVTGVTGVFFYPYNRSPVVGLALSVAFQLGMLLAAYNAEVLLVGLQRKVRTRWVGGTSLGSGAEERRRLRAPAVRAAEGAASSWGSVGCI